MIWFLTVWLALGGVGRALADEMRAAAGTGETLEVEVLSRLPIEDVPGHELIQSRARHSFTTPDPIAGVSFAEGTLHIRTQSDLVKGSGLVRGYGLLEAKTGEKLHVVYGYQVSPTVDGDDTSALEGTFQWAGGSGVLANVEGSGRIRGHVDDQGHERYRWEVTYRRKEGTP